MKMKRSILKVLLLVITLSLLIGLVSCSAILEKLPFEIPGLTDKDDDNKDGEEKEGLVLIENGKANFQIVLTTNAGSDSRRKAKELVKQLKNMGIEISEPVEESKADLMTDCEIIIGTGAKHRGPEFDVNDKDLGKDGRLVKIVGKKILIAAGTAQNTAKLFENYITNEMKITAKTTAIDSLVVDTKYSVELETKYLIDTIKVNGVDFKDYVVVYDIDGMKDFNTGYFRDEFADKLYETSGCWFEEGSVDQISTYANALIFKFTNDAGENGFRVYSDGKHLYAECSYANAFERAFEEFANEKIFNAGKNVTLDSSLNWEKNVKVVNYSEFGAKGNGIDDDYAAIKATHEYANAGGQKVLGNSTARYYIDSETFTSAILVKTDVDFQGATFIIDDRGDVAYEKRSQALFMFRSDNEVKEISVKNIQEEGLLDENGNLITVPSGTTQLDWIKPYIEVTSMVRLRNKTHMDYIRHGSNQNAGHARHEMIVVNPDGSITEDTTVFFDYDKLTDITIWRGDDKPITVENGLFYNICCQAALVSRGGITEYKAYARGMSISRSNLTIKNVDHRMIDQPEVKSNMDNTNGSYPYGGFLSISGTYKLTVEDCELAGHVTYYEAKSGTESANQGGINYVAAGSYDFVFGDSTHIKFNGVTQKNMPYTIDDKTHVISKAKGADAMCNEDNYWDIGNNYYWGIMCSNFVKNLDFNNCVISRIDAHEGFFNVKVTKTVIGHTFHAVGGGTLELDEMERIAGPYYVVTRGDYGGSFKGTMSIKNGTLHGFGSYNTGAWKGQSFDNTVKYTDGYVLETGYYEKDNNGYWNWDFGYDCYMPEKITMIESFNSPIPNIYISNKNYDDYWEIYVDQLKNENPNYHPYELIKELVFQDWDGPILEINKNAAIYGTHYDPKVSGNNGDYMATYCDIKIVHTKEKNN